MGAHWQTWDLGQGRLCKTNPIRRDLPRRTKPIPAVAAVASPHYSNIPLFQRSNPMAIVQNKANLRRSLQWRARTSRATPDGGSTNAVSDLSCETKPISPALAGMDEGRQAPGTAGPTHAKQSQFGQSDIKDKCFMEKGL